MYSDNQQEKEEYPFLVYEYIPEDYESFVLFGFELKIEYTTKMICFLFPEPSEYLD